MSMHDPFFHYLYCRSTAELNTVSAPDPQTRRREESGSPRTRGRVAAPPLAGRPRLSGLPRRIVAGAAVSHLKLSAREAFWVSGMLVSHIEV